MLYLAYYNKGVSVESSAQLTTSAQNMQHSATKPDVASSDIKPDDVISEQIIPLNQSGKDELRVLVNNVEEEVNVELIYDELAIYYDGPLLKRLARYQDAKIVLEFHNSNVITEESIEKEEIIHSLFNEYLNNDAVLIYDAECNAMGCEIKYKSVEGHNLGDLSLKIFKSLRMLGGGFSFNSVLESDNRSEHYLFYRYIPL